MHGTLLLGAVAYDPKVVTIWEGFIQYFAARALPFDVVLFTNYERQVESLLAGEIDVAWNSPLAWIEAERGAQAQGRQAMAIAMRDSDRDLTSLIVARADSPVRAVSDLRGKTVACGASDSPQATLIPLEVVAQSGLLPEGDFRVLRHEMLVGKHGDHIGGERAAARSLMDGKADAACMIESNHALFAREGVFPPGATTVVTRTPAYDHCNFTVVAPADDPRFLRFRELLLGMSYHDPEVRPLLDMEGLKAWMPGRTTGYDLLNRAVDRFGTLDRRPVTAGSGERESG